MGEGDADIPLSSIAWSLERARSRTRPRHPLHPRLPVIPPALSLRPSSPSTTQRYMSPSPPELCTLQNSSSAAKRLILQAQSSYGMPEVLETRKQDSTLGIASCIDFPAFQSSTEVGYSHKLQFCSLSRRIRSRMSRSRTTFRIRQVWFSRGGLSN